MKKINKAIGYLAVAAICIALIVFTDSVLGAIAIAWIGFEALND